MDRTARVTLGPAGAPSREDAAVEALMDEARELLDAIGALCFLLYFRKIS